MKLFHLEFFITWKLDGAIWPGLTGNGVVARLQWLWIMIKFEAEITWKGYRPGLRRKSPWRPSTSWPTLTDSGSPRSDARKKGGRRSRGRRPKIGRCSAESWRRRRPKMAERSKPEQAEEFFLRALFCDFSWNWIVYHSYLVSAAGFLELVS